MATVSAPRRVFDRADTQRRVRHPLQALRKYIRLYVVLEGLLVAFVYLALWFWIGLALDYGLFLIPGLSFDWVQELNNAFDPTGALVFRAVLLGAVVLGLVALVSFKIGLRLIKEFRDTALAMVLERRFPRELGDRLITAVELADPRIGEKYGFSTVMIEKTILDAAERVERVPVKQVFNWGRLYKLGVWCGVLSLGLYLVVGAVACVIGAFRENGNTDPLHFVNEFSDVSQTWVERNVLLMNSYWPRNAFLEVVRFNETSEHRNEMRVGRDEQRPDVQVRAVEWVIADRGSSDGWRPLRWSDLPHLVDADLLARVNIPENPDHWGEWLIDLDDLHPDVPTGFIPPSWQSKKASYIKGELHKGNYWANLTTAGLGQHAVDLIDWKSWTMDRLALQKEKKEVKERLLLDYPDAATALDSIFVELADLAESSRFSRKLRKLAIPKTVMVYYRGDNTKSSSEHKWLPDNKYAIGLNELKESVRFTVQGGDYYTPYKKITLVPPPTVNLMTLDKKEPAYLHHWLVGGQAALKGERQVYKGLTQSVTGDRTTITIPYGSDLVLRCVSDRALKKGIRVRVPQGTEAVAGQLPDVPVEHVDKEKTFSIALNNVQKTHEFNFEFNDLDNVKGRRRIKIQPEIDTPPEITKLDPVYTLRKPRFKGDARTGGGSVLDGYLITPIASLPFNGVVKDDHGLMRLDWAVEVEQIKMELFGPSAGKAPPPPPLSPEQARIIAGGVLVAPGQFATALNVAFYWREVGPVLDRAMIKNLPKAELGYLPVAGFTAAVRAKDNLRKNVEDLTDLLIGVPKRDNFPFLLHFDLKERREEFDVGALKLNVRDPQKEGQLHYQIKLSLSATDNNIETGNDPAKGGGTRRSEPSIAFLVVSEIELLAQVALEEEVIGERMDKVLFKLRNSMTSLSEQVVKLSTPDSELSLVALRSDEVRKYVMDGGSNTKEMLTDYIRIFHELRVNGVRQEKLNSVEDKIITKLEAIVEPNKGNFTATEDAVAKLYQAVNDDVEAKRDGNRDAHRQSAQNAQQQLNLLISRLNEVAREMAQGIDWAKSLDQILAIERIHREQQQILEEQEGRLRREIFGTDKK